MKKTRDYDNIFQTIKKKHKRLLIAIINNCFQKNYPENAGVEVLPTRSQLVNKGCNGESIIEDRDSDCVLRISDDYFLLEVQAYDDDSMAIRIAEYTFLAARDIAEQSQGTVMLNIPHFTVIYIKPTAKTPRYTEIIYVLPDGQKLTYREKNIFLSDLTKEEIIEKRLYAFIPFYIARYEKELSTEKNYIKVLEDLEFFHNKMIELNKRSELTGSEMNDLGGFVNTIVTHITDGNSIEKEVTRIMGGEVIETLTEKIIRETTEKVTEEVTKEVTKEVTEKVTEEWRAKLDEKDREIEELRAKLAQLTA